MHKNNQKGNTTKSYMTWTDTGYFYITIYNSNISPYSNHKTHKTNQVLSECGSQVVYPSMVGNLRMLEVVSCLWDLIYSLLQNWTKPVDRWIRKKQKIDAKVSHNSNMGKWVSLFNHEFQWGCWSSIYWSCYAGKKPNHVKKGSKYRIWRGNFGRVYCFKCLTCF